MAAALLKSTLTLAEATVVSAICFGLFILSSTEAVLAGFPEAKFSESSNSWSILIEVILASIALLYLRSRNFEINSLYPRPNLQGTFLGLGVFTATWLIGAIATAPFVTPERPMMTEFSFNGVSLTSIILFAMVNGAFEEIFLLGVLVRGLRGYGLSVAIGVPLLVRVLYHLYQGPLGAVWILAFGFTFTLVYLRTQQLWPLVLAHILWDIVPVYAAAA
jgi:membrane protease YdiL (CAAX protease family)